MHPAQVPFVGKAQAPLFRRAGDPFEVGGILGSQDAAGVAGLQPLVHGAQELHPIAVDPPALIPLPVEDAADGVEPQAVEVVAVQPVVGRALQEAAHLPAGVHEVAAAPLADPHVLAGIFIQAGPVKPGQAVGVHRKVGGHKVQQHRNAPPVQRVHQRHQPRRRAVAAGGGKKAGGLVAPALVAGVLGQGQELHGVVAALGQVVGQRLGQLLVGVEAAVLPAPPGPQVDLVDVQRPGAGAQRPAAPGVIPEGVFVQVPHHRPVVRAQLHAEAVGVAVVHRVALPGVDPVGVDGAGAGFGQSQLIKVAVVDLLHRQHPVQGQQLHRPGRRGKHPEGRAPRPRVGAEILVGVKDPAGVESVKVHTNRSFPPGGPPGAIT